MTHENDSHEPVTVTDRRRIDPETGAVRDPAAVPTPEGPAPAAGPAGEDVGDTDEAAELKATLQRVKAEYDNFRKRTEREKLLAAERGKVSAVLLLLPVLDDLERARSHGDLETGPLKSVADKLGTALDSLGLVAFGTEGDDFDPSRHEAVQHDGDGSHPVLGTVMRRGYLLGENVLRPALVGVVDQEPVTGEPPADTAPGESD